MTAPVTPEVRQAAIEPLDADPHPPSTGPAADGWRRLRRNPIAILCMALITVLIAVALLANFIAPYHYDFQDTQRYMSLPSGPDARHLLGLDDLGQDVLSRVIYGARISLGVAAVVVGFEILIGVALGIAAGYYSGWIDLLLMRVTDVMFAFPGILLAILLTAIVRSGSAAINPVWSLLTLFAALAVVSWPGLARLVRGQALALRRKEFVEAARAMGVKDRLILLRHILPNLLSPIIVQVTQDVAAVILAEATLSFLGLGVQPPFPSWGRMIEEALPFKESHPLLLIVPSVALALTVMAFNFFGDALRDALDPRLRG
ncbi:MAG TPA: ABC transporter permease [Chthonomonadales bacterium]|nr:ABC transporter permease [Chthonomonadales bacterium]